MESRNRHIAALRGRALIVWCVVAAASFSGVASAEPDAVLPPIGGQGGGGFVARCGQGDVLTGFDLRAGDDIDAISPICVPALAGQFKPYAQSFGGSGGSALQLVCPNDFPAVTGIKVGFEGVNTVTVNNIHLYCGRPDATSKQSEFPSAVFDAPRAEANCGFLDCTDTVKSGLSEQRCPAGQIGVGVNGRAGVWLDSVGLICGSPSVISPPIVAAPPPITAPPSSDFKASASVRLTTTVKAQRRVKLGGGATAGPSRSVCDLAAQARARNSPAAPGLEAKCAEQNALGIPAFLARGEAIANADPLAVELRDQQPDEAARRGFDIGMAVAEGHTAPGPGKQKIHDLLAPSEQGGYAAAVAFSLERNKNAPLAANGAAIAASNSTIASFRNAESDVHYRLGFDIGVGFFDDASLSDSRGLNALAIRDGLSVAGKRGFDAATLINRSGVGNQ